MAPLGTMSQRYGQKRLPLFQSATTQAKNSNTKPQTSVRQPDDTKQLEGFFLFVENQIQQAKKAQSAKEGSTTSSQSLPAPKAIFEKLILAAIVNKSQSSSQQIKQSSKPDQYLQMIDYIRIAEKTRKLVEVDEERGVVFLINNKYTSTKKAIRLYSVQLKQLFQENQANSDSDEDQHVSTVAQQSPHTPKNRATGIKFNFIKEMRLVLSAMVTHNLTLASGSGKKVRFIQVQKQILPHDDENYFIYASIGGQILAYQLNREDLQPNQSKQRQYKQQIGSNKESLVKSGLNFQQPLIMPESSNQDPLCSLAQTISFGADNKHFDRQFNDNVPSSEIDQTTQFLHRFIRGELGMQQNEDQQNNASSIFEQFANYDNSQSKPPMFANEQQQEHYHTQGSFSKQEGGPTYIYTGEPLLEETNAEKEEVKRELQEAIDKELNIPSIMQQMNAKEEEDTIIEGGFENNSSHEENIGGMPKDQKQPAPVSPKPAVGKEIRLNQEKMKIIQQLKQIQSIQSSQNQNAAQTTSKKKKKTKKGAAGGSTTPTGNNEKQQQISRPISPSGGASTTVQRQSLNSIQQIGTMPANLGTLSQNNLPFIPVVAPNHVYQQKQSSQILAQPSQVSAAPKQQANVGQPQQVQYQAASQMPQAVKKSGKIEKQPHEIMIDNIGELSKKYQELAQKFQKVSDQLTNLTQQQNELDRCIHKNIQKCLPEIIEQQMKEKVVPMVVTHLKGVNRQIKEEIMPQVEAQMGEMVAKLIKNQQQNMQQPQSNSTKLGFGNQDQTGQSKETFENEIRTIVVDEFANAMEHSIKPILQEQFQSIIVGVKSSLTQLNQEFTDRLQHDENEHKAFNEQIQSKLSLLTQQSSQNRVYETAAGQHQSFQQYPPINTYPPEAFPPPYYAYPQPVPYYSHSYQHGYPPNIPHPSYMVHPQPPPPLPMLYHQASYQVPPQMPQMQSSSRQQSMKEQASDQLNQQFMKEKLSQTKGNFDSQTKEQESVLQQNQCREDDQIKPLLTNLQQQKMIQPASYLQQQRSSEQTKLTKIDSTILKKAISEQAQNLMMMPITSYNQQEVLIYDDENEEEEKFQGIPSSSLLQQIENQQQEAFVVRKEASSNTNQSNTNLSAEAQNVTSVANNTPVYSQQVSSNSPNPQKAVSFQEKIKDQPDSSPGSSSASLNQDSTKINWEFIPYMKEVATKAKASAADFLLCGSEVFLRSSISCVQNHSHIITNQYKPKIIHQFIKKIYQRAKESEKSRKGAIEVMSVFIEKIYKQRAEMKQQAIQATQWEEEIRKLIQGGGASI